MSDYVKKKVLRFPLSKEILKGKDKYDWVEDMENKHPKVFNSQGINTFEPSDTEEDYLDYVLEYSYGEESGDYGYTWKLTEKEKEKYEPLFSKLLPNIDMDKVHKVIYCYYNCCESPDYYEIQED